MRHMLSQEDMMCSGVIRECRMRCMHVCKEGGMNSKCSTALHDDGLVFSGGSVEGAWRERGGSVVFSAVHVYAGLGEEA